MTIELSMRRRATQRRLAGSVLLITAAMVMTGLYFSLPSIASKTLTSVKNLEAPSPTASPPDESLTHGPFVRVGVLGLATLGLGILGASIASMMLGRAAFQFFDNATRLESIADSLCLCGNDLAKFEKATSLLFLPQKNKGGIDELTKKDFERIFNCFKKGE